jgi:hypothetical protein
VEGEKMSKLHKSYRINRGLDIDTKIFMRKYRLHRYQNYFTIGLELPDILGKAVNSSTVTTSSNWNPDINPEAIKKAIELINAERFMVAPWAFMVKEPIPMIPCFVTA